MTPAALQRRPAAAPVRAGSRLTAPPVPAALGDEVGPLNFRQVGEQVLLSNDQGRFVQLAPEAFERFLAGRFGGDQALRRSLTDAGLLRTAMDFPGLAADTSGRELMAWPGPSVHTVVVTLRCNMKCLYCHASVVAQDDVSKDMTLETARRVVDFIFSTPNPELMIEFQGGEPLLNWPVVRFVVEYARLRAAREGRTVHLALISNFTLLDEEKARWLAGQGVSFCTSFDGPPEVHDRNRIHLGGSTQATVAGWVGRLQAWREQGLVRDKPNAIATVTRFSLPHPEAVVDAVVGLGLERIQLGPLDPIGFAKRSWPVIGYTPEEFCAFYARALDRAVWHWQQGTKVYEKMALIFLIRVLERGHWRFPNGDGLCRLAYDFDGGVYVSEEARLLANEGEPFFRIGEAGSARWADLLASPTLQAVHLASRPSAQPMCSQCAYAPYCTVAPVHNFQTQGTLWGRMPDNHWCRTLMGIFDILFERLQRPESRQVFEAWVREFSGR